MHEEGNEEDDDQRLLEDASTKIQAVMRGNLERKQIQKMKEEKHHNCVILAAEDGPMTLQEVGDIFNVTRMRICQIEKLAKRFLRSSAPSILSD